MRFPRKSLPRARSHPGRTCGPLRPEYCRGRGQRCPEGQSFRCSITLVQRRGTASTGLGRTDLSASLHRQTARQALLIEPQPAGHRRLAIHLPVCGIGERTFLPVHGLAKVADLGTGRGQRPQAARVAPARRVARPGRMLDGFLPIAECINRTGGEQPCQVVVRGGQLGLKPKRFVDNPRSPFAIFRAGSRPGRDSSTPWPARRGRRRRRSPW